MPKQVVKGLENIGKVAGVKEVVEATEERHAEAIEEAAAKIVGAMLPKAKTGEGDLNALLNLKPSEFIKEGRKTAAIITEGLSTLEALVGKLDTAKETLQKIREANRKKGLLGPTGEICQLEAMIEAGTKAVADTDEEVLSLYRFRRDHAELRAFVDKGHAFFKALRNGESADQKVLEELKICYADFLHNLLREERIVEVESEQLRKWSDKSESFSDHASSWMYKNCRTHDRKICTHWFWGVSGDDQSIQLAKDLRALNNINSRIRNHLNPRRP